MDLSVVLLVQFPFCCLHRKASQMNSMFRQNPYDSSPYDSYTDHDGREQRQSYSVDIPMATMQPGLEVSQSAKRWGTPNANPYGNTHSM